MLMACEFERLCNCLYLLLRNKNDFRGIWERHINTKLFPSGTSIFHDLVGYWRCGYVSEMILSLSPLSPSLYMCMSVCVCVCVFFSYTNMRNPTIWIILYWCFFVKLFLFYCCWLLLNFLFKYYHNKVNICL